MFLNSSFKVVDVQRYYSVMNEASALNDNRFAVINGLMFELSTTENDDDSFSVLIGVFNASDVNNPSCIDALTSAYSDVITNFELHVTAEQCEDNGNAIVAEREGDAMFIHLISLALTDASKLRDQLEQLDRESLQ